MVCLYALLFAIIHYYDTIMTLIMGLISIIAIIALFSADEVSIF